MGDILSTVGDILSTMGVIMSTMGLSSTVGDIMGTMGGNLLLFEYPMVLSTPRYSSYPYISPHGTHDISPGDILSTVGGYLEYHGGYHEYHGGYRVLWGISWVPWGEIFSYLSTPWY